MRRFTLKTSPYTATTYLEADPKGGWVPVADYQKLQKQIEKFATSLEKDAEASLHTVSYLRSIARR